MKHTLLKVTKVDHQPSQRTFVEETHITKKQRSTFYI
jgi:hypothetical protein